jgi:hypothetical protein
MPARNDSISVFRKAKNEKDMAKAARIAASASGKN